MKKIEKLAKLWILAFLLLPMILLGCSARQEDSWEKTEISNPILIGTDSCKPPCWQEMDIRRTTYDHASERMVEFQTKEPDSRLYLDEKKDYITFTSKDAEIVLRFENGKLFFITFRTSSVDLGSIIAHYGFPEKYYVTEDPFGYVMDIFYPEQGIIFRSANDFSPVSETMTVIGFIFYAPEYNPDSFLEQFYGYDLDSILTRFFFWEGFGKCPQGLEFPEYCDSKS